MATAETDADGVYMFEGLEVGKWYFVTPEETDLYTAVRGGNTGIRNQRSTDVVKNALTRATTPPAPGTDLDIPSWNNHTSTATGTSGANGSTNFALLYKDGEVEGEVSDPSARAAHSRSTVELHLCKTTDFEEESSPGAGDGTALSRCTAYADVVEEADVDANGNWSANGLREGIYEVIVDLPAGYEHVANDGTTTQTTTPSLFTQQMATLTGGRADATTETFHIRDRNASADAGTATVTVDAAACTLGTGTTNAENRCGSTGNATGSYTVVVTAPTGATVRLSNLGTDDNVNTAAARSFPVNNRRASTVTLSDPGTERFYVHVRSQDGYQTNGAAGLDNASTSSFTLRRDADVRAGSVTLRWDGGIIVLDRRELGLDPGNPDGETGDLQGLTTIRVTVSGADGTDRDVPISALTVEAASVTTGFGVVTFEDYVATETTHCDGGIVDTSGNITLPNSTSSTTGRDGICFRITDSDGDTTDVDAGTKTRDYLLIVTRGRNAS